MSGRGAPVERPNPWTFLFGDLTASKGWEELKRAAPNSADQAWVAITSDPRRTDHRQHQLKGSLGTANHKGHVLPQWQYECTGGGRVWYAIDESERTLVMTHAGTAHPKQTDKPRRKKR